jgi:hypothetical protein
MEKLRPQACTLTPLDLSGRIRRQNQTGALSSDSVSEANAIGGAAVTYFLVQPRRLATWRLGYSSATNRVRVDRLRDILQVLNAEQLEVESKLTLDLIVSLSRNADAAAFRERFEPRSNVNPLPVNVVALCDYIPQMHPDPETHAAALFGNSGVTSGHPAQEHIETVFVSVDPQSTG